MYENATCRAKIIVNIFIISTMRDEGWIRKSLYHECIGRNDKHIIIATCNATVKDALSQDEINNMILDIYVGCTLSDIVNYF